MGDSPPARAVLLVQGVGKFVSADVRRRNSPLMMTLHSHFVTLCPHTETHFTPKNPVDMTLRWCPTHAHSVAVVVVFLLFVVGLRAQITIPLTYKSQPPASSTPASLADKKMRYNFIKTSTNAGLLGGIWSSMVVEEQVRWRVTTLVFLRGDKEEGETYTRQSQAAYENFPHCVTFRYMSYFLDHDMLCSCSRRNLFSMAATHKSFPAPLFLPPSLHPSLPPSLLASLSLTMWPSSIPSPMA